MYKKCLTPLCPQSLQDKSIRNFFDVRIEIKFNTNPIQNNSLSQLRRDVLVVVLPYPPLAHEEGRGVERCVFIQHVVDVFRALGIFQQLVEVHRLFHALQTLVVGVRFGGNRLEVSELLEPGTSLTLN